MSRGILLFAHDNQLFPYHRLAVACAWFIRRNMPGVEICVAGDEITIDRIRELRHANALFDHYRTTHVERNALRNYYSFAQKNELGGTSAEFLNKSRSCAYELSPFDETLLIDLDYLVMNDQLNSVWGSDAPILINSKVVNVCGYPEDHRIHPAGIPQYWATVMYFQKSPEAKVFFDGMEHVKTNYEHFSRLYRFSSHLFRNDHAVSIVAHLMNGGVGENAIQWPVRSLPDPNLIFAWGYQPILRIEQDRAWFAGVTKGNARDFCPSYVKGQSVHAMEKASLVRVVIPWVEKQIEVGNV